MSKNEWEQIIQKINIKENANKTYLQNYLNSEFDSVNPKKRSFVSTRKRVKCKIEHEKLVFFPSCEIIPGNPILLEDPKVQISLTYNGSPITIQPQKVNFYFIKVKYFLNF